jgi:hypothetical protein
LEWFHLSIEHQSFSGAVLRRKKKKCHVFDTCVRAFAGHTLEGQNQSTFSIPRLKSLLILHLVPIDSLSCCGLMENTHLDLAFPLRCFQRLCTPCVATQRFPLEKELIDHRHDHYRSSRTMSDGSQYSNANIGYGPNCLTHVLPLKGGIPSIFIEAWTMSSSFVCRRFLFFCFSDANERVGVL